MDPFDYHLAKCGENAFKTMECNQIQTYSPDEEVEEEVLDAWDKEQEALFKPDYCNRNNEMVKSSLQICVICFENPSVYAFRQCGHQVINVFVKKCYEKKCDRDMLKYVFCRQG